MIQGKIYDVETLFDTMPLFSNINSQQSSCIVQMHSKSQPSPILATELDVVTSTTTTVATRVPSHILSLLGCTT